MLLVSGLSKFFIKVVWRVKVVLTLCFRFFVFRVHPERDYSKVLDETWM